MLLRAEGPTSLSDLFAGRSQLIVYHVMSGSDWDAGCKSCSFLADHFDPAIVHLNHRDVSMVAVSMAPLATLEQYKKRMGWSFRWVSSYENDFNRDYNVSFTEDELERGLDMIIAAYHYLDIVPKGRDKEGFEYTMERLRRGAHHSSHDRR